MARGFGSTLGSGATDAISTALTSQSTQRSWAVTILRNGAGAGTGGRILAKEATQFLFWSASNSRIRFTQLWTGGGELRFDAALTATGTLYRLVYRYDGGNTANNATLHEGGSSVSLTRSTSGSVSGSPVSNSNAYLLGNVAAGDRNWDGTIAEFAVWDEIIPVDAAIAISNGFSPLFYPNNLIYYAPLIREVQDLRGGLIPTVTGTAVQPHSRIIYPAGGGLAGKGARISLNLSGSSNGTSIANGSLRVRNNLTSSSNGTSTTNAELRASLTLSGSSNGGSTANAELRASPGLSGSSNANSTANAALAIALSLTSSSNGISTATGSLEVDQNLSGTGAGIGAETATLSQSATLSGSSNGASTANGTLSLGGASDLSGLSNGASTANGALNAIASLNGLSNGTSASVATTRVSLTLSGLSNGNSTGNGTLEVLSATGLSGSSNGGSTANGSLSVSIALLGSSAGMAGAIASLNQLFYLSGSSNGASTANGLLTDSSQVVPLLPPVERTLVVPTVSRVLFVP